MRANAASLVVAFLVLGMSGCAGSGGPSSASPTSDPWRLVPIDADWGAAEGYVFGTDQLPIPNVTVEAPQFGFSSTSDAYGYYYILNLTPGQVELRVNQSGYQPIVRRVGVPLGDSLFVNFTLVPVPAPEPYIDDSYTRRGVIQCQARANATGTNTNPSCSDTQPGITGPYLPPSRGANISMLPEMQAVLVEVHWQQSIPTNQKLRLAVRVNELDTWQQFESASPLRVAIQGSSLQALGAFAGKDYSKEGGQLFFNLYSGESAAQPGVGGAGATIQQDYTMYASVFYRQTVPQGYTRLPPA